MEEIKQNLTQLSGAVNLILEQLRSIEGRLGAVENERTILGAVEGRLSQLEQGGATGAQEECVTPLVGPTSEQELREISRLPDCVKELQSFDGNPVQYVSWVHSVENILKDYDIVKNKPIFRAILQHIRQKIKGKQRPRYKKETVARDNKVTVVTASGKKFHKEHIKN